MSKYQQIISAAQAGALILTANERLFRYLRGLYDQAMQNAGEKVWATPQIISYQGWMSRCLDELGEGWRLLEKNQALRLWEQLIEDASRGSELELLQVSKTAEKAYQAFQSLKENALTLDDCFLTDDQQVFQRWFSLFNVECQKQEWLDRSELAERICQGLHTKQLPLPQQILLVGFDQLPPGAELLRKTCQTLGGDCREFQLQAEVTPQLRHFAAQDADQEIEHAARWARRLLDQGAESIGVVVFDLQARRRKIERIFRDQIDPAASPELHDEEANFSLSLGGPLSEQGVIHAACEILAIGHQLSIEQASFLLRTPYLAGSQQEAEARSRLDRHLRSFRQQQIALNRIGQLASDVKPLANLAAVCEQLKKSQGQKQSSLPGAWAEQFAAELQQLGWPGERSPASSEYQAIKAWREKLLPVLAALDQVSQPIARGQALSLLRRLANDIDFQLESPTGSLQVVGQLESAGLCFDHLWVMGVGEQVLPAAPRPNPFIPYDLQQQYAMPHANAERELAFAEQVVARLQTASPDVIFSYPDKEGDCDLRPSPLLPKPNCDDQIERAQRQDLLSLMQQNRPALQQLTDDKGPPLADGKGSGGTSLLKDQAHCPFRAFVHHRLRGREIDKATVGLDAMTRGDLVHLVLERLWTRLQDQQTLLALSEEEQHGLLAELVALAIDEYFTDKTHPSEQLLQLEKERIELLLQDWIMSVERKRDPFRVAEMEQEHIEQLGPLQIKTKVDRIDLLADGSRIVIDYKTGASSKADDLLSAPLLEPQLPIYAAAEKGTEADGVTFAQVRRGDCRLIGVVREKGLLGRVKALDAFPQAEERGLTDWEQLQADWRSQLEGLADDFVAGQAPVRPFNLQRSCQYCDLPGLCRINEAVAPEGDE